MLKKSFILICSGILLSLFSCNDDSIDLDNISTDGTALNSVALPIGSLNVEIGKALDFYSPDVEGISIGSTANDLVELYYEQRINAIEELTAYTPELAEDPAIIANYSVSQMFPAAAVPFGLLLPVGNVYTHSEDYLYTFHNMNDDPAKQEITYIDFTNASLNLTLTSDINFQSNDVVEVTVDLSDLIDVDGSNANSKITMKLGQNSNGSTTATPFTTNQTIKLKAEGRKELPIPVDIKITGDGMTTITAQNQITLQVDLNVDNASFVAYGKFRFDDKKTFDPIELDFDLAEYLPAGTIIKPLDPVVELDLTTDIGIPLSFNLNHLTAESTTEAPRQATFNGSPSKAILMNRPASAVYDPAKTATTTITLNNTPEWGLMNNVLALPNMNKLKLEYDLGVNESTNYPLDYISSESTIRANARIKLPIALAAGSVIAYSDTILDLDLGLDDEFEHITEAGLLFNCTNNLPMGITVHIALLDENLQRIAVSDASRYEFHVKSPEVNADGTTMTPAQPAISPLRISYDANTIEELRQARNIEISFRAEGAQNGTQPLRLKMKDYVKFDISAHLIGGVKF